MNVHVTAPTPPCRRLEFRTADTARELEYYFYRPSSAGANAPVLVSVHGIARNAAACALRFMSQAERHGVIVVAPLFSKAGFGQYQQLKDASTEARSDLALMSILDDVRARDTADVARIALFGYSGGGQFGHRFAMAHPTRVACAVVAAAGWYTLPDLDVTFPYGLGHADAFGLHFDLKAIASLHFHVVVGAEDNERDRSLRKSKALDEAQGRTRLERAETWSRAMRAFQKSKGVLDRTSLIVLPGVGHSFLQAMDECELDELVVNKAIASGRWPTTTIA